MKVYLRKYCVRGHGDIGSLRPTDDQSRKVIGKLKHGEIVRVDVVRPRNERQHRLFWALMTIVSENSRQYPTPEHVADAMKVATGYVDTFISHKGDVYYKLRSIAYDEMDQDEFDIFFNRCIDIIVLRFLPNLPEGALRRQVEEMCGVNYGSGGLTSADR